VKSSLAELEDVERELLQLDGTPAAELIQFLDGLEHRVKLLAFKGDPRHIDLLINIAAQFYLDGREVRRAVEPLALAAVLAEEANDSFRRRRALSVQGLALANLGQIFDALRVLRQSLQIAEQANSPLELASVWGNIGVAFMEATLYAESNMAFRRSLSASEKVKQTSRSTFRARAFHGFAVNSLHLHDYPAGLAASTSAIEESDDPQDREHEQMRALIECTYAQLLLRVGRFADAEVHANAAMVMAVRSGSTRARIEAMISFGLVEVYTGKTTPGLARIGAARRESRAGLPAHRLDALRAVIQANEKIGRPDEALRAYRDLMDLIRQLRMASLETATLVALESRGESAPRITLKSTGKPVGLALSELSVRMAQLLSSSAPLRQSAV
jgi:tetratricopeptide (TPR) repeat protein